MCQPEHFGVVYAINPWMKPQDWQRQASFFAAQSRREWAMLRRALSERGAAIELVPPCEGLPDLVFTANAAVVLDGKALLARFRYPQRQAEERHFHAAFRSLQARGVIEAVHALPDGLVLEGAGDCVFDSARNLFWMGYGPRSDAKAADAVEEFFGIGVAPLELRDARFYHMDTALCPLPGGEVIYVPGAFTAAGRAAIADRVGKEHGIELGEQDACAFAANAVCLGDTLIMSACSTELRARLAERGYRVSVTPLGSFLRSGGAAFCLTLRLDRRSAGLAQTAPQRRTAAASAGSR
jgi:N-dimethylarginine dimethylaminohydrolase